MVVETASRYLTTPSNHNGTRKRRARKRKSSSKRFYYSTSSVTSPTNFHHENFTQEHPHGSRLINQQQQIDYSSSSLDSVDSLSQNNIQCHPQTVEIQIHQEDDKHFNHVSDIITDSCDQISLDSSDFYQPKFEDCSEQDSSSPNLTTRRQSPFSRTLQNQSNRIRLKSCRKSGRARNKSESSSLWHERIADKFVKQAHANDFSDHQVVAIASSLLSQHIQTIKDEELVLDWSQPEDQVTDTNTEEVLSPEDKLVVSLNYKNSLKSSSKDRVVTAGIPVESFPPSLIKWPGNNNNKQKRLAEIKKQVKLLSSIIKMTIEGGSDQSGACKEGGSVGIPAPFTHFIDIKSIPSSALTNANGEDSLLPSIDEIKEFIQTNKMKDAKALLRNAGGSITCTTRPKLWQELCKRQTIEQFSDSFYYDTIQQIYGTRDLQDCRVVLPAFVDTHHMGRCVTSGGLAACGRIISVLAYYYPPITYAPALHPLAAYLLLFMNEPDVYNSLSALVCSSKVTFLTQTKISNEVTWRTTLVLARKHVGSGFSVIEKYGVDSKQVEVAFQDWLWWILEGLPLPHVVRVLDCFLLEGWKVLVRVSLAIFQLYIKQISRDTSAAATLSTKGLSESIMIFCRSMTIQPAKLMKTAFGIRALSISEMQKVMSKTEHVLQKQGGPVVGGVNNTHEDMTGLHRAVSIEGLPTASAQADVQMLSHTLNVKELLTIWNWMPVRMTMYQPSLLYTTEEHGSSLTTFYQRVGHHEPTIILIRTTCDHVFGAYCSTAWNARHKKDEYGNNKTYYGTGETFLFTLRPVPAKYQWVGITQQEQDAALKHVKHSAELFMHGDDDMITIGGGEGQGITLDHELQFGKTESCQTFDNPPLCPTKDFEIKVVEVYGIDVTQS